MYVAVNAGLVRVQSAFMFMCSCAVKWTVQKTKRQRAAARAFLAGAAEEQGGAEGERGREGGGWPRGQASHLPISWEQGCRGSSLAVRLAAPYFETGRGHVPRRVAHAVRAVPGPWSTLVACSVRLPRSNLCCACCACCAVCCAVLCSRQVGLYILQLMWMAGIIRCERAKEMRAGAFGWLEC